MTASDAIWPSLPVDVFPAVRGSRWRNESFMLSR
jgi:hypothetical protein